MTVRFWCADEGNKYNGMAEDAKLAFFDIGLGQQDQLLVPSLELYVFPSAADAGAHIHSNSWGASFQACDELCTEIDNYTYIHDVSTSWHLMS